MAAIGLVTVAVNAGIAVYQTRAGSRKNDADAAASLSAAASGMVDKLRAELDRREKDCSAQIARLSEDMAKMQAQIAHLEDRVEAQDALLRRKDAHLAIAVHQLEQAGVKPLWEDK